MAFFFQPGGDSMPRVRRTARHGDRSLLAQACALAAVIALWAVASSVVPPLLLPSPGAVFARILSQIRIGIASAYVFPTVIPALGGLVVAVALSLILALAVVHSRILGTVVEPVVALSQTVPLVAIAPLLVLWMGYGAAPIAVLCAIVAFFPMVTTMIVALRGIDPAISEHATVDGATGLSRWWHIEMPIALPGILTGIRAGAVLTMTGALVGELVMGGNGLGSLLTLSRQSADTVGIFTVIVWISSIAMVLYAALTLAINASRRMQ